MTLEELNQVRNALYEAHNQISGKIVVKRELMLTTIEDALQTVTKGILEARHGG